MDKRSVAAVEATPCCGALTLEAVEGIGAGATVVAWCVGTVVSLFTEFARVDFVSALTNVTGCVSLLVHLNNEIEVDNYKIFCFKKNQLFNFVPIIYKSCHT